ncbi:VOC family protein [Sulfurivirga sp.]|uniref:VOC family protein n=1 Tax=Sulfurivirga sp. TaxID=2614236 RepID=UPI0025F4858C|nr:VOC family protein [Sulfurivirga sp.]
MIGLDHVSVIVRDAERAREFYQQILGVGLQERPELGFPGYWLALAGGQSIHLMALDDPCAGHARPEHGGRDYHFALRVADLAPFIERLEAAGVPYTRSRSGRPAIFFRDPDGNAVELLERPSA